MAHQHSDSAPNTKELERLAAEARLMILDAVVKAGSGHVDSSYSIVELVTALYHAVARLNPDRPDWPERDRVVLSKGHAAPALYAALAQRGFFPRSDLGRLRQIDSHLQGHPKPPTPGVDAATGSLGQGLSIACGMSYAARYLHKWQSRVFAILSDGELNEGQTWEAVMMARHFELGNLTAIVDANGFQYTGRTRDVLDISPIADRFAAFGWHVEEIDGHSFTEVVAALSVSKPNTPSAIVARTIKGKGVSFIEGRPDWHGRVPSQAEYVAARGELATHG